MASSQNWSVIAVTCPSVESALALQKELEIRQQKGSIPKETIVLAVDDPRPLIGSGSATLNALLLITQQLSMRTGLKSVDPNVLNNARILIMHMGRQSALSPCGSAFITLPIQLKSREDSDIIHSEVCCNIDLLLFTLSNIVCVDSPPGVWVSSSDMILSVPEKLDLKNTKTTYRDCIRNIEWSNCFGVHVISVPTSPEYAKNHGIIKTDDEGTVENIFYLPTEEELQECQLEDGNVPVLPVIIFLSQEASKRFLLFCTVEPLDNCTFIGLDNGAEPIVISFLFDILLCMAKDVEQEEYVSGERSRRYTGRKDKIHTNIQPHVSQYYMKNARKALWNKLRDIPLKTIFIKNAVYNFLFPSGTCYSQCVRKLSKLPTNGITPYVTSTPEGSPDRNGNMISEATINDETLELNNIINGDVKIEKNSVIMHCNFQGNFQIESECFLSGLDTRFELRGKELIIPRKTVVQGIRLKESSDAVEEGNHVVTIAFGIEDNLTASYDQPGSSFCNKTWVELFQRTGIKAVDLWTEDASTNPPCLLRAKLFPVFDTSADQSESSILWWLVGCPTDDGDCYSQWRNSKRLSIEEIMTLVSFTREFSWRRNIFFKIGSLKIKKLVSSTGSTTCIHPFLTTCVKEGFQNEILSVLDEVACSSKFPSHVARILSHIADVLSIMAGPTGGLRSGPSKNPAWTKAMNLLEKGNLSDGVKNLAKQRKRWKGSALMLIRCARHYEGAGQMLIRQAVLHTKQLVDIRDDGNLAYGIGKWITAEAPCRIDLSGGWSDTPPITYEHGGTVTNVAIKIDGRKPIGAKIRKIPEFELVLVLFHGEEQLRLNCATLEEIRDYSNPSAPGALLKTAFLCTNTVSLSSGIPLNIQLKERYGCGFELHTWSRLPHGSGLGTSSILAGVVCAAILRILGRNHDNNMLVHLVIHLEQMLTTGGGWQDQVGGLFPGVKITTSAPMIPIMVTSKQLDLSTDSLNKVAEHTALIYTGKTRLAKYILQDVIRRWYARFPEILKNVDELTKNAEVCAEAWQQGNLEMMGDCLNTYRQQKKIMAPSCEPDEIIEIINAIQSQIHACCLAGAGGGGFLFVITRRRNIHNDLRNMLKKINKEKYTVHQVEVDNEGLTVHVE